MIAKDAIRVELAQVLRDPVLQRSPMQSRLLEYLGERTLDDTSGKITQLDIAVDGLGRDPSFDESAESYVRVQVSRLRKTLEAYYAKHQPVAAGCIYIKTGEYCLRINSLEVAYPALATKPQRFPPPENPTPPPADAAVGGREAARDGSTMSAGNQALSYTLGATLLLVAILAALLYLALESGTFGGNGRVAAMKEPPSVSFSVETVGTGAGAAEDAELLAIATVETEDYLTRSLVARVANPNTREASEYHLQVRLNRDSKGQRVADFTLRNAANEVFASDRRALPTDDYAAREVIGQELAEITSPPGALTRGMIGKLPETPRTGFECFLALEVDRSGGIALADLLRECGRRFSDSAYGPQIVTRQLFFDFQDEVAAHHRIRPESPQWKRLGRLLGEHPKDPYVNALAAKVLFSQGRCSEGKFHAGQATMGRHQYPALELAIAVEMLGCDLPDEAMQEVERRVLTIVESNAQPHSLLHAYSLFALLALDRKDIVAQLPDRPFSAGQRDPMQQMVIELQSAALAGRPVKNLQAIERLVWNPEVARRIAARFAN